MIEPGFARALPVLAPAENAVYGASFTKLEYVESGWDGRLLDNDNLNWATGHFVVAPWMPASVKVRAIIRYENASTQVISCRVAGYAGQLGESAQAHTASDT